MLIEIRFPRHFSPVLTPASYRHLHYHHVIPSLFHFMLKTYLLQHRSFPPWTIPVGLISWILTIFLGLTLLINQQTVYVAVRTAWLITLACLR